MTLTRMPLAALLIGAAALALPLAAQAQVTGAQQSAIRANCRSDFMAHCSGVTPGGKDALECLQKNVASLSSGCKTAVSATMPAPVQPAEAAPPPTPTAKTEPVPAAPAAPSPAPAASAAATPAAAPAPKAAAVHPAPAKKKKTTATAATAPMAIAPVNPTPPAVAAPPPQMPKAPVVDAAVALRACKLDLIRHCRETPPGEGRKLACLTANSDRLTIRCRTALNVTSPLR